MSADPTPTPEKKRTFSLSIGQLTFGSFLLVLAVIIVTSAASVIAIRHIDTTFAELQRLQSVGDLAEDIDRRMNELRLAARDFVTDPGAGIQFKQVGEAASTPSEILKKTRIELAPEQQDMIDGVTERLATYRSGLERISTLIDRRAQLLAGLPPLRDQFDAAVAGAADRELASRLSEAQSRIALGLLARNPSAAEHSAEGMRTMDIADAKLKSAVNDYADAIVAVAVRERQIADIDREVPVRALTEQRLAEESYRKLFEGSVDGIYVTTPAGDLLNANPALARMMGYDSPQHLIDSINDIAHTIYVHPEARQEYQRLMHRDGMVREFE